MIQLQELEGLVAIFGKDVIAGKKEEQVTDLLSKVSDAVQLFERDFPEITEDLLQDLTIRFSDDKGIVFNSLREILVVLKIFQILLEKKEKEMQSLNTPERSRRANGLFVYKIKFDRVMNLVQSNIWKEESKLRTEKTVESLMKSYSLTQVKLDIKRYDDFEDKIEIVDSMLESLHSSEYVKEYIPDKVKGLEMDLLKLRSELTIGKALNDQKTANDQNIQQEIENMHLDIFKINGFKLFDYLIKNHLTNTQQSDISYFFRRMEKDGLIHARQTLFKDFLMKVYPDLEPMGKIKLFVDVNSDWRQRAYSAAKERIGLK